MQCTPFADLITNKKSSALAELFLFVIANNLFHRFSGKRKLCFTSFYYHAVFSAHKYCYCTAGENTKRNIKILFSAACIYAFYRYRSACRHETERIFIFHKKFYQQISEKILTNPFCLDILSYASDGILCNGSTADSDSVCWGSNPYIPAKTKQHLFGVLFLFSLGEYFAYCKESPARSDLFYA